jgi:DNA polymerase elongation subunit (family B)
VKILTLDIETCPGTAYWWSRYDDFMPMERIITHGGVLSVAAKWHDQKRTMFWSDWTHGHAQMVEAVFLLLDIADVVVTYNGDRFDLPWLQTEFGTRRPAPYKSVDLYKVVKRNYKLSSYKLKDVATFFGLPAKLDPGGFETWPAVMAGDVKAQKRMEKYNRADTVITDLLLDKVLPFVKLPNRALVDGVADACPTCAATESLIKWGFRFTEVGKFQRYRCQVCASFATDGKRLEAVSVRRSA